jgi:RimJ/RimL family protein N-acetyltransferase
MQPTFSTDRLTLSPRSAADTEACLAMDLEPEVLRYLGGPVSDPEAQRARIEARTRGPYGPGLGYWSLREDGPGGRFAGWILLIPVDGIGPEIEVGWRLPTAFWGRGLATEAARLIVRHGFETLRLREIIAEIDEANAASIRVAEKLGLSWIGERLAHGQIWQRYAGGRA